MTSPVNLHPKIEGVWARQIASFGEVKIEHAWPHGNASASWAFPAGTSHRALHAGATVEIFDGGVRVWKGILQEPGLDGSMSARGLWTEGKDALALNGSGASTTYVSDAVDAAKTRGALTWGSHSLPFVPVDSDNKGIFSVAGLLDEWAAKDGKRWGLDPNGNVLAYADPTTPSWHVPHAAAGRGLTPADDDFATDLYGVYLVAGEERAIVTVGDSAARTAYGRRVERTVDLTNLGPMSAAQATATLQNTLNLSAARLRFADGLDLQHGQITTPGGAPAPLSQVRAGQVVRLHGVKDPRGVNGIVNYTDVLIGKSAFDTSTQTLSIAPVDAAPRGFGDALETSSGSSGAAQGVEARVPSLLKPVGRLNTYAGRLTQLPNDGALRTVFQIDTISVPSNAVFAQVSMSWNAHNAANAANHWYPLFWDGTSGWVSFSGELFKHNQNNTAQAMGSDTTFTVDVRTHLANGQNLKLAINGSNDAGSGAWTDVGYLSVTITWLGF